MGQKLRLMGRYSGEDLELSGDSCGLKTFSELLISQPAPGPIGLCVPEGSAAPYLSFLSSVQIMHSGTMVDLRLGDGSLLISGPLEKLLLLAHTVRSRAEADRSPREIAPHVHIDFHPAHHYPPSGSCSLVLVRQKKVGQ